MSVDEYNILISLLRDRAAEAQANRLYRYTDVGVPMGPITATREAAGETLEVVTTTSPTFAALRQANLPKSAIQKMYADGQLEGDAAVELYRLTEGAEPVAPAAPAPAAPAPAASNLISLGSRGAGVTTVQQKLSALSSMRPDFSVDLGDTGADGAFGKKTKTAVEDFQRMAGITVDGKVGPKTLEALDQAMKETISAKQAGEGVTATTEDPRSDSIVRPIKTSPERLDMSQFDTDIDAMEDITEIDPIGMGSSDGNYEGLNEKPRRSAFPMFHERRHAKDDRLHDDGREDSAAHRRVVRRLGRDHKKMFP